MQKIVLSFLIVAIAAAVALPQAPAALGADPPKGKLTCVNGVVTPTPETNAELAKCKDPAKWGLEEGKRNPNCDGLCTSSVLGYLGSDNKPNKVLYWKWIESDFPKNLQTFAKKHMTECFANHGGAKIDVDDKTCPEVKKFDTCGWAMQPNLKC